MRATLRVLLLVSFAAVPATEVRADEIAGLDQMSFSGAVGVTAITAGSHDAAVDGILDTPGMGGTGNGVSLETYPLTVTYDFDVSYDVDTFKLLGEFGSNSIGAIKFFDLTFHSGPGGSGVQVGPVFSGVQTSPTSLQSFDLGIDVYVGVRSFSLTPHTDVHDSGHPAAEAGRVEWSEMQFEGAPSAWQDLGAALVGTYGDPVLLGTGSLVGGEPIELVLTNALENATYTLVVGLGLLEAPFKGGVLVPAPDIVLTFPPVFPGTFAIGTTWPTGVPPDTKLYFQYWITDPAAPKGFSASNALSATTP